MREMKDSGIISMGFIPVDWAAQRVKYVSKVLYGYPLDSNLFSSDGFPMIRIRDITSGEIETYYKKYLIHDSFHIPKIDALNHIHGLKIKHL